MGPTNRSALALRAIGLIVTAAGVAVAGEPEPPPAASDEGGKPPPWWNQSPPPASPRPSYTALGFDEDWSFLSDPKLRGDYLDRLKYLGLGLPGWYLTLGGFVRLRYELAPGFPPTTPYDRHGYFLQRYLAQGDLHLSRFVRVFVQLKSALENGRDGGPLPIDVDQLDLAQGFVELSLPMARLKLTLRGGRQELSYGSQRLLDIREGPNNPQSFDGLIVRLSGAALRIDLLMMRTVADRFGVFDDGDVRGQWLWGAYGSFGPVLGGLHLDTYYLGFRRLDAQYARGSGDELRHTLGLRLYGQWRRLEYDGEVMVQLGRFARDAIAAWDLSLLVRRPFTLGPVQWVMALAGDVASGDQAPAAATSPRALGTFSTLFARGSYFTEAGYLMYANTANLHPGVELHLPRSVALTVDVVLAWRSSTRDTIYGPSLQPVVTPVGGARYIGTLPTVAAWWNIDRHLSLAVNYSHLFDGPFLRDSGIRDFSFFAFWVTYLF